MSLHQELIPGVHRIELPLPIELESINVYLVRLDNGYLLVDCGMNTADSFASFESSLSEVGIQWTDIRLLVLTHMHPDHIGLTNRVRALSGATVVMHEAEAEHLDSVEDENLRLPYLHAAYTRGGVPIELQSRMDSHFAFLRKNLQNIKPDKLLRDGERIETAIGPLIVVTTPGHSPGHICLYSPDCRILFSGDHILDQITPNISWHPGSDALGDYLDSLDRVGRLDVEHIYPSHGSPFTGHREWIRETAEHHRQRCDEIIAAIEKGATTAHEMVGHLWPRPLDPIHHHFAVFEILAHVEYMERRGRVRTVESSDGALSCS